MVRHGLGIDGLGGKRREERAKRAWEGGKKGVGRREESRRTGIVGGSDMVWKYLSQQRRVYPQSMLLILWVQNNQSTAPDQSTIHVRQVPYTPHTTPTTPYTAHLISVSSEILSPK